MNSGSAIVYNKSTISFTLDSEIFKINIGDVETETFLRAFGTSGFVIQDGFDTTWSGYQPSFTSPFYINFSGAGQNIFQVSDLVNTETPFNPTDVSDGSGLASNYQLTGISPDYQRMNPCQIEITLTIPDLTRDLYDAETSVTDSAAWTSSPCPSSTSFFGYKLVIIGVVNDATGLNIAAVDIPSYIYRQPLDGTVFSSFVTLSTMVGSYTVTYAAGMADSSDFELATRTHRTLTLSITNVNVCTS